MGTAGSPAKSEAQPVVPSARAGRAWLLLETALRVLALLLSMAAALVLAKVRQDTVVNIGSIPVQVLARHSYVKAYVFLVYVNGAAAIYSFVSALLSLFAGRRPVCALLFAMDLVLSYLMLAAAASATEASYIAKRGEAKVGWGPVCANIQHFCAVVGVSLLLSFLATIVLLLLAILSSKRLFSRPPR